MLIHNVGATVLVFVVAVVSIRFIRKLCKRDYMYLVNYIYKNSQDTGIGQINISLDRKVGSFEDIRKMERIISAKDMGNVIILNYKLLRGEQT